MMDDFEVYSEEFMPESVFHSSCQCGFGTGCSGTGSGSCQCGFGTGCAGGGS